MSQQYPPPPGPPQPQQPPFPPPGVQRYPPLPYPPRLPSQRQARHRRKWLIIGAITLAIVVASAVANATEKTGDAPLPSPTALVQQQAQSTQPSPSQPTSTPTPRPHPTRAQVDTMVQQIDPTGETAVTSYSQATAVLILETSFGYKVAVTQATAKRTMQDIQSKVWQQSLAFASVTVNLFQYQPGGARSKKIADSTLLAHTAAALNFTFAGDLWDSYDAKWMDPSLG